MVMGLLTMIRDEWAAYKIDEDTQNIQNLAVQLYERHVAFGKRLAGVGKGLKSAMDSYDDAIKSYQGRISIRKTGEEMISHGIKAKAGNKELPELLDTSDWKQPPDVQQLDSIPTEDE